MLYVSVFFLLSQLQEFPTQMTSVALLTLYKTFTFNVLFGVLQY